MPKKSDPKAELEAIAKAALKWCKKYDEAYLDITVNNDSEKYFYHANTDPNKPYYIDFWKFIPKNKAAVCKTATQAQGK